MAVAPATSQSNVFAAGDQTVNRYVNELKAWENALRPIWDVYDVLWKDWAIRIGERDPENPYLSNVRIPYGFHAVETILPRVIGEDPSFSYRVLDFNEDAPTAAIMSGLVTWQVDQMALKRNLREFFRQGLICGHTVAKVGWVQEYRTQTKPVKRQTYHPDLNATLETEHPESERVLVKHQPFFESVDVRDFVYPLNARNIQDASAVWQRRFVTLGYLRKHARGRGRKNGAYMNVDQVQGTDYSQWQSSRKSRFDDRGLPVPQVQPPDVGPADDDSIVEIWERWTNEHLCTIASPHGNPILLRDERNFFWHCHKPYVDWAPMEVPFQMPGVGVIEVLHDLNEDLNTLRRQRRDALTFSVNPMWKAVGGLDTDRVILQPGGKIDLDPDSGEDLIPLTTPPSEFASSFNEEERIIQDMQNLSGAFNYLSGDSSQTNGQQTATGVATITNEGNKRIAEMIAVAHDRMMKPLGRLLASMNAQYIDQTVAADFSRSPQGAQAWQALSKAENLPEGLVNVDPGWLKAKGRLEPVPEIGADKDLNDVQRRSDATQVMQAIAPLATLVAAPGLVNVKQFADYLLKQFGVPSADRDMILDTAQQEQEAAMAQAQAQAQMQAQAQPQSSGPSGPSGDNRPTGAVGGAPGVAGT